jgi:hypothetical protein
LESVTLQEGWWWLLLLLLLLLCSAVSWAAPTFVLDQLVVDLQMKSSYF